MTNNIVPPFPLLKIVAFIDESTVIVAGDNIEQIDDADELYILGESDVTVPGIGAPLVIPKASLVVQTAAGVYAVARTPGRNVTVNLGVQAAMNRAFAPQATRVRRPALLTDKTQFIGNPGSGAVTVGDRVVRKSDLKKFMKWATAKTKTQS
jgi:hypothetical protein